MLRACLERVCVIGITFGAQGINDFQAVAAGHANIDEHPAIQKRSRRQRPRWAELLGMTPDACHVRAVDFLRWTVSKVKATSPFCVNSLLMSFCKALKLYQLAPKEALRKLRPTCQWQYPSFGLSPGVLGHSRSRKERLHTRLRMERYRKPRLAYIVLAHGNLRNLRRLTMQVVGSAEAADDMLIVHIDQAGGGALRSVAFVNWWRKRSPKHSGKLIATSRQRIARGGQNMMRVVLNLLALAAAKDKFDHFVLLSGSDLLLRTRRSLYWTLWAHRGLTLLPIGSIEWLDPATNLACLSSFHKTNRSGRMPRRIAFECGHVAYGLPEIAHEADLPVNLIHANGAQWAVLSPNFTIQALAAADLINQEPPQGSNTSLELLTLQGLFGYVDEMQQPDERLLPTLLLNSNACAKHVGLNLHIVNSRLMSQSRSVNSDFEILSPSPFSLAQWNTTLNNVGLMKEREGQTESRPYGAAAAAIAMFGRKFDDGMEGRELYKRILRQSSQLSKRQWVSLKGVERTTFIAFGLAACAMVLDGLGCTANVKGNCDVAEVHVRVAAADSIYDAALFQLSLRLRECCPRPSVLRLTMPHVFRDCGMAASFCLEELPAVAQPVKELPSDDLAAAGLVSGVRTPRELPPRILIARVGVGWDPRSNSFLGSVSLVPQALWQQLTLVLYVAPSSWPKRISVKWILRQTIKNNVSDMESRSQPARRRGMRTHVGQIHNMAANQPLVALRFPGTSLVAGYWDILIFSAPSRRPASTSTDRHRDERAEDSLKLHQLQKQLRFRRHRPMLLASRSFVVIPESNIVPAEVVQKYFAAVRCIDAATPN